MKRRITSVIIIIISFCLCFSAHALAPQRIKSLHPRFGSQISDITLDGESFDVSKLNALNVEPGSVLDVVLAGKDGNMDLFLDQNDEPINSADVTISKMRAANIGVRARLLSNTEVIDAFEVTVSSLKPVLRLQFDENYRGIESINFQYEFVIVIDGEEQAQSGISIAGVFGNREIAVSSVDSVISDSSVIVAGKNIPSITLDAGMGVTLDVSLNAGGRYIAAAESSGDYEPLRENSHVIDIIKLKTDGFTNGQIKSVRIINSDSLFVYDRDIKFIGMTNENLPYSDKYYIADKKIDDINENYAVRHENRTRMPLR